MVINRLTVVYSLFEICALFAGVLGGVTGMRASLRWGTASGPESRRNLENMFYLAASAVSIGILLQLVMLPLWFYMLHQLISVIPGAMCLGGVHHAVPLYSWAASGLKLILPLLYISWLVMTRVDSGTIERPYLRFRYMFLGIMSLFLLVESFYDIAYLLKLKPIPVSCCTALFDFSPAPVVRALSSGSIWYVVLAAVLLLLVSAGCFTPATRTLGITGSILTAGALIAVLCALHSSLSPLILDAPFHHCIFCLLQNSRIVLGGFALLLTGLYSAESVYLLEAVAPAAVSKGGAGYKVWKRLRICGITCLVCGSGMIGILAAIHLIK